MKRISVKAQSIVYCCVGIALTALARPGVSQCDQSAPAPTALVGGSAPFSLISFNIFDGAGQKLHTYSHKSLKNVGADVIMTQEDFSSHLSSLDEYELRSSSNTGCAAYAHNKCHVIDHTVVKTKCSNPNLGACQRGGMVIELMDGLKVANLHLEGGRFVDESVLYPSSDYAELLQHKLNLLRELIKLQPHIVVGDFNSVYSERPERLDEFRRSQREYFAKVLLKSGRSTDKDKMSGTVVAQAPSSSGDSAVTSDSATDVGGAARIDTAPRRMQRPAELSMTEADIAHVHEWNSAPFELLLQAGYTYAVPSNEMRAVSNGRGWTIIDCVWYKAGDATTGQSQPPASTESDEGVSSGDGVSLRLVSCELLDEMWTYDRSDMDYGPKQRNFVSDHCPVLARFEVRRVKRS